MELFRLCSGFEAYAAAIADAVLAGEHADAFPHRIGLAAREMGAAAVQPLVSREQLGPVALERLEEVLARVGRR